MDFRIIPHHLRKPRIIVQHLDIIGDADTDGDTGGEIVAHLDAAPIGLLMKRALVAIAAVQKEQRVQLPIAARANAFVHCVNRAHGLRMLVIRQLDLPVMLVHNIRSASVLKSDAEAARIGHQFEIPLLQRHVMIELAHLLCRKIRHKKTPTKNRTVLCKR